MLDQKKLRKAQADKTNIYELKHQEIYSWCFIILFTNYKFNYKYTNLINIDNYGGNY